MKEWEWVDGGGVGGGEEGEGGGHMFFSNKHFWLITSLVLPFSDVSKNRWKKSKQCRL